MNDIQIQDATTVQMHYTPPRSHQESKARFLGCLRRDAIHAVSSSLVLSGYPRAILHGSAGAGGGTFVLADGGVKSVSDIDVVMLHGMHAIERADLESSLNFQLSSVLAGVQAANVRVSVRCRAIHGERLPEWTSLKMSALGAGRSARRIWGGRGFPGTHTVTYPYALEFGLFRWIECASAGHDDRTAALYELAKGLRRLLRPAGRPQSEIICVSDDDLIREITGSVGVIEGLLGVEIGGLIRLWIAHQGRSALTRGERASAFLALNSYLKLTMGPCNLADRVGRTLHGLID